MPKIVIIGAGSHFGARFSLDVMSRETLRDGELCLCDIHPGRLKKIVAYAERAVEKFNLPTRVVSSTDRRELLPNADFVITSVAVGGPAYGGFPSSVEKEIPLKYGIDQSVADTIGIGGVFRFLRTGPVQNRFYQDVAELAPDAIALNYTNPMAMLTWLHSVDTGAQNVGLCHSVQGTTQMLARRIDAPYDEVSYKVAGINHQAWVLEFYRGKEDLYPRLREAAKTAEDDIVRFEMMKHFGYFVTESSSHNSEYLPYFRRTEELKERYGLAPRQSERSRPRRRNAWREWMRDSEADVSTMPEPELNLSHEYATGIMEGVLTNRPFVFNGNVMNNGLITNLPDGCCVEVPCLVDGRGIHPVGVGDLPPQLAALNRSNIAVQELAVRAVLDRDREAAFHACAVDPLASSVASLDDIRAMFEELWEAEKDLLKWFDLAAPDAPEICAA